MMCSRPGRPHRGSHDVSGHGLEAACTASRERRRPCFRHQFLGPTASFRLTGFCGKPSIVIAFLVSNRECNSHGRPATLSASANGHGALSSAVSLGDGGCRYRDIETEIQEGSLLSYRRNHRDAPGWHLFESGGWEALGECGSTGSMSYLTVLSEAPDFPTELCG
jgi:hypothetical protein